ncbi:MAG: hypothetical protein QOH04_1149 [Sphingomonadales bacterium]|jgi:hypothetical protein|nr:hypothetical protein [Sphingomonadales bacterium]MEA3035387.1 hypothetical protein [Sphingomonadales bacterium]
MTSADDLREQAQRCREHAREYHPSAARPLLDKARLLDFEAAMLERAGRERRGPRASQREAFLQPPRPVFGRAPPRG